MKLRLALILTLFGLLTQMTLAQVSIPGDYFNRIDKYTDSTTLTFYSSIQNQKKNGFLFLDPFIKSSFNSNYPRGYNDGAVWKGKGLTVEGHAGFQGRKGKLSFTFFPVAYFSQNASFELAPLSSPSRNRFAYQFANRIDWVQQYGDQAFFAFHPGQSEIRFELGSFISSISTQNYSLGPAIFNPILLSRQAGGFPHVRLGSKPFEIKIKEQSLGLFEVNSTFGLLRESDYFDGESNNDKRYINTISLAYSPSFLPELTLGLNRVAYKQTRFFEPADFFATIYTVDNGVINGDTISVNDTFDQLASVTAEWNLPTAGFRTYIEFAHNDHTKLKYEPEHSRAFTIGFEKRILLKSGKRVEIVYEHTNLSLNASFTYRISPTYYVHNNNTQGYTNNGQIVGAGIGPGGNSDHFSVNIKGEKKSLGLLVQRIESDRDYFLRSIKNKERRNQEYSFNIFYQVQYSKFVFATQGTYSHDWNRYYGDDEINIFLSTSLRYKLH